VFGCTKDRDGGDAGVTAQGSRRDFNHPKRGLVAYQQVTLHPMDQEQIKLVLLKPEG
jgi:hypothetical protein